MDRASVAALFATDPDFGENKPFFEHHRNRLITNNLQKDGISR